MGNLIMQLFLFMGFVLVFVELAIAYKGSNDL